MGVAQKTLSTPSKRFQGLSQTGPQAPFSKTCLDWFQPSQIGHLLLLGAGSETLLKNAIGVLDWWLGDLKPGSGRW